MSDPFPHSVAIALGSNLGEPAAILKAAITTLSTTPDIQLQAVSSLYQTKPVGGPPQPDYLNACALLNTPLDPQALLQVTLAIESQFGRVRRERNGPRLLDLDILLYDDWVIDRTDDPPLVIPHPRMTERAFVLVPLQEIAPDWVEPVSGRTIAQLVQQVDRSGVQRIDR